LRPDAGPGGCARPGGGVLIGNDKTLERISNTQNHWDAVGSRNADLAVIGFAWLAAWFVVLSGCCGFPRNCGDAIVLKLLQDACRHEAGSAPAKPLD
jgi:hypothetical protein